MRFVLDFFAILSEEVTDVEVRLYFSSSTRFKFSAASWQSC